MTRAPRIDKVFNWGLAAFAVVALSVVGMVLFGDEGAIKSEAGRDIESAVDTLRWEICGHCG